MSMAINPELASAKEIAHLIQVPDAMEIDSFAKGKVDLLRLQFPRTPLFIIWKYRNSPNTQSWNPDLYTGSWASGKYS